MRRSVAIGSVPSGEVTFTSSGNVPGRARLHLERHRRVRGVERHDLRGPIGEVQLRARHEDAHLQRGRRGAANRQWHSRISRSQRHRLPRWRAQERCLLVDLGFDRVEVLGAAIARERGRAGDEEALPRGVEEGVALGDHRREPVETLPGSLQCGAVRAERRGRRIGERAHDGVTVVVDRAVDSAEVVVDRERREHRGGLEPVEERVEEDRRRSPVRRGRDHGAAFARSGCRSTAATGRRAGAWPRASGRRARRSAGEATVDERGALDGDVARRERGGAGQRERQVGRRQKVFANTSWSTPASRRPCRPRRVERRVRDPGAAVRSRKAQARPRACRCQFAAVS